MLQKITLLLMIYIIIIILLTKFVINLVRNRRKSYQVFITRTIFRTDKLIQLYHFFSKIPFFKGYLRRISRRYEILCPGDKKLIYKKSIRLALLIWIISGLIISFIFIRRPSFYHAALTVFLVWAANSKITLSMVMNGKKRLLKQMDDSLSDIRHNYYINGSVEDALSASIDLAGNSMKIHLMKIYEIITSDNMEEEIIKYNDTTQNSFLKLFLAQCITVVDYGDKNINGTSLFLHNVLDLKRDIIQEIRRIRKIQFMFMGIGAIIAATIFFLDPFRKWAVSTFPGLYAFYYGEKGVILLSVIFLLSVVLYTLVGYLEEDRDIIKKNYGYLDYISNIKPIHLAINNYMKKHYGKMETLRDNLKRMGENITPKQLIAKRLLYAFSAVIFGVIMVLYLHNVNRQNIIYRVDNVDQLITVADEADAKSMKSIIIKYVDQYKDHTGIVRKDIESKLSGIFQSNTVKERVSEEIIKRITEYQNEYLKWYEMLGILALGYLAYCLPYWMILFRKNIMLMNMNDEVLQFQSIILMLMHIDHIIIPDILELMESFAVIFQDSIRICLNEYDAGDMEALYHLKERESFKPFQRLVDDYLISDKIGIERAFDEVAVERANSSEQRKDDIEMNVYNKGILAKLIVYVFVFSVLIIYLVLPFLSECMRMLYSYGSSINNI